MNGFELPGEGILHIERKWENNRIESDPAALKKLITPMRALSQSPPLKVHCVALKQSGPSNMATSMGEVQASQAKSVLLKASLT